MLSISSENSTDPKLIKIGPSFYHSDDLERDLRLAGLSGTVGPTLKELSGAWNLNQEVKSAISTLMG